jgi:hypothetical protein
MPTKCMDQIPIPIENPPPSNQARVAQPVARRIRTASVSAVYDAKMATTRESATRP